MNDKFSKRRSSDVIRVSGGVTSGRLATVAEFVWGFILTASCELVVPEGISGSLRLVGVGRDSRGVDGTFVVVALFRVVTLEAVLWGVVGVPWRVPYPVFVAANCVANARCFEERVYDSRFVQWFSVRIQDI